MYCYSDWTIFVRIAARVCAPQPQFLYIINRLMFKNDSNAALIAMVLSLVNSFANQFSIFISLYCKN